MFYIMQGGYMTKVNSFNELVANKLNTNKNVIKISLNKMFGEKQAEEIRAAAEKMKEKMNPKSDIFVK